MGTLPPNLPQLSRSSTTQTANMPTLNLSELNIVISVLGAFTVLYGIISVKLKQAWYLGEALPAVVIGIILGPVAAKFIESEKWGNAEPGQTNEITLGLMRVMIGVQLVIAGYQLPAKYLVLRWKEMLLLLLPVMTIMWLSTTLCILATVPKLTLLAALVIGSCVTCTDPILSQAIAKGPFADKYVARPLREIISAEAGANDGFGFPFLMLATYLIRHGTYAGVGEGGFADSAESEIHHLMARSEEEVGRLGGGVAEAMKQWFVETWLYVVLLSVAYGIVVGLGAMYAIKFALKRRWIDSESYLLFPTALGLFLVGTCGAIGTDDLLACFVAGNALNWDGEFLAETERRHDEVNSCVDVLLNFGGFMYIGTIMPWSEFHDPEGTGLTIGLLIGLGFLVLIFRRIPAILIAYKLMPKVVADWKEALFMGYFGPIGAGAVFYLEHSRHLFPELGHGLSIPALNLIYVYKGVQPIKEDAVSIRRASIAVPPPSNVAATGVDNFIVYNRFSRSERSNVGLPMDEMERPMVKKAKVGHPVLPEDDEEGEKRRAARRTIRYMH